MKPEKRKYQGKAVRKIEHFHGRALLAAEMRTGKTFISLIWLSKHPEIQRTIVVCPEIGKLHWEEKAKRYFNMRSVILNGTKVPKQTHLHKHYLYILNWDILQYWADHLKALNPQLIILDEIHAIKEPRTFCYKATKKIAKCAPYILGLSGTPLKSRPIELFNALNLIRPDKFPSRMKFAFRHCNPKRKPWGWEFKGASHLDELNRNLNAWCMIRMLRKDVMNELPKDRQIVPISISDINEYFEAENSFIKWLTKRSSAKANKAKKAERLVQMGYLKRLAASLKMENTLKWINNYLRKNKGKIAIFAIHKDIIKILKEKYQNKCVVVDGSVRGRKRHVAVKKFQTDKSCRIFVGNTKAAGTVIELSSAKAAIIIEFDWTPGDVTQCEDRIFNQKEQKSLLIYYLVAKNTIEHHLCEILQEKQTILSETLDGDKKKNQLSVFDELQKKLLLKG